MAFAGWSIPAYRSRAGNLVLLAQQQSGVGSLEFRDPEDVRVCRAMPDPSGAENSNRKTETRRQPFCLDGRQKSEPGHQGFRGLGNS